jgi:hypothetical protein
MKPLNRIKIKWSPNFAYAIGLLATDGNLSGDGRHIIFTSKDKEQILNFLYCLQIKNKITKNVSGFGGLSLKTQIGDVNFYKFLGSIGLTAKKSYSIGSLGVPDKYFFDFLRGHFDGDGTFYSYWDPRWKSSYMFYVEFISASLKHIKWLQFCIIKMSGISGKITKSKNNPCYRLKFAKKDSLIILMKIYYPGHLVRLTRKHLKIKRALAIIDKLI